MEGYSKDGRKLRPRKTATSTTSEKVDFSSSERKGGYGSHKPRQYGEGRPSGERRQYGESRPHGNREGRPYGDRQPRQYGESRPYGERRQYGEDRPHSNRESRPYGDRQPRQYGESRPHGERRQYGEDRPHGNRENRPYGDRQPRQYGESRPYGERRSAGRNRSFGNDRRSGGNSQYRKPFATPHFNKNTEEGINRMISRRPVVNGSEMSDFDALTTPVSNEIRLNKFIANSGVCSRREADTLIQAGVVTVNGEVITELGTKVNIFDDDIRFNGERLKGEQKVYIVMNKPAGFVTTASDPHAEKTVMDLLKNCETRVYPVGRLDKATTGVLMFTNDGEIAERLTHPSYNKKKIYQVALDHALGQEDYDKILEGIELSDGEVKADSLEYIDENDKRKLGIEIHSGKNRVVRRIFESLGYNVKALDRVYFAGLTKKGLKKGEWRFLTEGEVNILKMGAYV